MGPIWDFDVAFGNYLFLTPEINDSLNVYTGFHVKDAWLYQRFFLDPSFVEKVQNRFQEFFKSRQQLYDYIDLRASVICGHIVEDNQLWGTICTSDSSAEQVKKEYFRKVNELKNWIESRFLWLDSVINRIERKNY